MAWFVAGNDDRYAAVEGSQASVDDRPGFGELGVDGRLRRLGVLEGVEEPVVVGPGPSSSAGQQCVHAVRPGPRLFRRHAGVSCPPRAAATSALRWVSVASRPMTRAKLTSSRPRILSRKAW